MFELNEGDAIQVSQFTAVDDNFQAGFAANPDKRFVMLLLGEMDVGGEFDPKAMLESMGWEKKEEVDET